MAAEQAKEEELRLKSTQNPWEKVCSNIDLNAQSVSASTGRDMTRMRAAMLARKADLTKANMKDIL